MRLSLIKSIRQQSEVFYPLQHLIHMYLTLSVSRHKPLLFDLFSVFAFLFFSHDSCPPVCVSSPHLCIFQAAFDESHWYSLRHAHKTSNTVVMWQRQNPSSYSLIILLRWQTITNISEKHGQVRHTHTRSHRGPTPSGHILITRHSCPHLRNWSCDGVRVVRATAIAGETYFQRWRCQPRGPRGAPAGRLSRCPIIKPNDSICALFNFDVPVMYYTIRLIWQFPLRLIKYLWREVDDKSYQRAIVRARLTRHIHQNQQSGPLALAY